MANHGNNDPKLQVKFQRVSQSGVLVSLETDQNDWAIHGSLGKQWDITLLSSSFLGGGGIGSFPSAT
jgi:hypothetical protein